MKERTGCSARCGILVLCGLLLYPSLSYAQEEQTEPGHPIGKVSTKGDLIVMELDEGAPRRVSAIAWRMRPCIGIRNSALNSPVPN